MEASFPNRFDPDRPAEGSDRDSAPGGGIAIINIIQTQPTFFRAEQRE